MQLNRYKEHWQQQKLLLEKSFDPSEEVICQTKIAEAKYYLSIKRSKEQKYIYNKIIMKLSLLRSIFTQLVHMLVVIKLSKEGYCFIGAYYCNFCFRRPHHFLLFSGAPN